MIYLMKKDNQTTSWHQVGKWYDALVGEEGHYYHQNIVLPGVLRLLDLKKGNSLLDIACGQGVLAKRLPKDISYCGLDMAQSLIEAARACDSNPLHRYLIADATTPFNAAGPYTHAALILAAQNMQHPEGAIQNATRHLAPNGRFVMVLNHPTFRIPRQTSWEIDEPKKMQYRRVERYMTPMEIPIQMSPGKGKDSAQTYSYHFPLSAWFKWLSLAGFVVESLEEWCSDKTSTGKAAKMENRARVEFPLFMAISAVKRP